MSEMMSEEELRKKREYNLNYITRGYVDEKVLPVIDQAKAAIQYRDLLLDIVGCHDANEWADRTEDTELGELIDKARELIGGGE